MSTLAEFGLPIQALSVLVTVMAAVIIGHALNAGATRRALAVGGGLAGWLVVYVGLVAAVSLTSREQVLPIGQEKRFCGFYLDCHAMVRVVSVERGTTLGMGAASARSLGTFYVVTVERSSDAGRVPIGLAQPRTYVTDAAGTRYDPSPDGSRALESTEGIQPPLGTRVLKGSPYLTRLVFDLPTDVRSPRLHVYEGDWIARLSELFLIGDEDSWLHGKVMFAL